MRILDLFCGGGGACQGMMDLGHQVVGWDRQDFSRYYPGEFHQGDVLDLPASYLAEFDLVWASPPCQPFATSTHITGDRSRHTDLIEPVRDRLLASGRPYIMENVPAAPIREDLMLCGSMFDLPLRRHRIFELEGLECAQPAHQAHRSSDYVITVAGHTGGRSKRNPNRIFGTAAQWREVMGIDWLPRDILAQAVPPVYSAYILMPEG